MGASAFLSAGLNRTQWCAIFLLVFIIGCEISTSNTVRAEKRQLRNLLWNISDDLAFKDFADALNSLKIAEKLAPNDVCVNLFSSYAYDGLKDYPKALLYANRALEAEPDNGELLARRSNAYLALHKIEPACADQRRRIETGDLAGYAGLAYIKVQQGNFREAIEILNAGDVAGSAPDHDLKALSYNRLGEKAKAQQEYQSIITIQTSAILSVENIASHERLPYRAITGEVLCQEYKRRADAALAVGNEALACADLARVKWVRSHSKQRIRTAHTVFLNAP